jgi:hypothetical protein
MLLHSGVKNFAIFEEKKQATASIDYHKGQFNKNYLTAQSFIKPIFNKNGKEWQTDLYGKTQQSRTSKAVVAPEEYNKNSIRSEPGSYIKPFFRAPWSQSYATKMLRSHNPIEEIPTEPTLVESLNQLIIIDPSNSDKYREYIKIVANIENFALSYQMTEIMKSNLAKIKSLVISRMDSQGDQVDLENELKSNESVASGPDKKDESKIREIVKEPTITEKQKEKIRKSNESGGMVRQFTVSKELADYIANQSGVYTKDSRQAKINGLLNSTNPIAKRFISRLSENKTGAPVISNKMTSTEYIAKYS